MLPVQGYHLTPHKVSLCVLAQLVLEGNEELWNGLYITKHQLSLYLADEAPKGILEKDFISLAEDIINLENGNQVLGWLQQSAHALRSPDDIFELFADISDLLHQNEGELTALPHVERSSVLGIFLRRCVLAFNRMMFDGLTNLWDQLQRYKDVAQGSYRALLSISEAEKFLEERSYKMEWILSQSSPEEIESTLDTIQSLSPGLTKLNLLRFASSLYFHDFSAAVDFLHRHFDYSIQAHRDELAQLDGEPTDFISILPYATLHLASVHVRFGHLDEALELVHETVRLVQERTDDVCLTYALMILRLIAEVKRDHPQQLSLLRQCLSRAVEFLLPTAAATSLLRLGSHYSKFPKISNGIGSGDNSNNNSNSPLQSTPAVDFTMAWRLMIEGFKAAIQTDDFSLLHSALEISSDMWETAGNTDLRDAFHFAHTSVPNRLLGDENDGTNTRKDARRLLLFAEPQNPDESVREEDDMPLYQHGRTALAKLALSAAEKADYSTTMAMLIDSIPRSPFAPEQAAWILACRIFLFDWAIANGIQEMVELQGMQLLACLPQGGPTSLRARTRIGIGLAAARAYRDAHNVISDVVAKAYSMAAYTEMIAGLLALADCHREAGSIFTSLSYAMSCVALCGQLQLDAFLPLARICLADILLQGFGEHIKAYDLITESMPQLLEHCAIGWQAKARFVLARCHICALQNASTPEEQNKLLSTAADLLTHSNGLAARANLRALRIEIAYWLARVYHQLGRVAERNKAAKEYRTLMENASSNSKRACSTGYLFYVDREVLTNELHALRSTSI